MFNYQFSSQEVSSTIQKFSDLAKQLNHLDYTSCGKCLIDLMEFCENDPIMRFITEPLVNMDVGLDHILDERYRPRDLTQLTLPDDANERLVYLYQFLLRISSKLFALSSSALMSQDFYHAMLDGLHKKFIVNFANEMNKRLEKISLTALNKETLTMSDLSIQFPSY